MLVSYCPKKSRNVLLVTSANYQPTCSDQKHKKPDDILLYNDQRCAVDVFNKMIKEYSSKPGTTSEWWYSVYSMILDMKLINAFRIFNWDKGEKLPRRVFIRSVVDSLMKEWLVNSSGSGPTWGQKMRFSEGTPLMAYFLAY